MPNENDVVVPQNANEASTSIRAVDRACDILFFLAEQNKQNLHQIAKGTGLPKTTVFRILQTLENRRLVTMDPVSMTYSLGFGFFHLATTAISQMDIREVALPYMREISRKLGANVNLNIEQNDYRIVIERIESQGPYRLYRYVPVGARMPLYVGASGKVILANLSSSDIDRIIDTQIRDGSLSKTFDIDGLYKELEEIRQRGYTTSWDELGVGALSIAVPLVCEGINLIGSLNAFFPVDSYHNEKNAEAVEMLLQVSKEIAYYLRKG